MKEDILGRQWPAQDILFRIKKRVEMRGISTRSTQRLLSLPVLLFIHIRQLSRWPGWLGRWRLRCQWNGDDVDRLAVAVAVAGAIAILPAVAAHDRCLGLRA